MTNRILMKAVSQEYYQPSHHQLMISPNKRIMKYWNWENQNIWNDVLMLWPLVTTAAVLMPPWQDASVPHPSFYDENKSLFRQCISKLYIKVRLEPGVCSALCISPVTHPLKKGLDKKINTWLLTPVFIIIYQAKHNLWCPENVGWGNFA